MAHSAVYVMPTSNVRALLHDESSVPVPLLLCCYTVGCYYNITVGYRYNNRPTQLPTMPGQPQRMGALAAVPDANLWKNVPVSISSTKRQQHPQQRG